jgi:hypothetical protein
MSWNDVLLRVVAALLVVSVIFSAGWTVQGWRKDKEIATIKSDHAKKFADAVSAAREKERELNAAAAQTRKAKDEEVAAIRTKLDAALIKLRNRPQRPSVNAVPSPAQCSCDAQGADGTKLFREDAEFLTREAARADELRAALKQCEKIANGEK